jgi:hypothetical protein
MIANILPAVLSVALVVMAVRVVLRARRVARRAQELEDDIRAEAEEMGFPPNRVLRQGQLPKR